MSSTTSSWPSTPNRTPSSLTPTASSSLEPTVTSDPTDRSTPVDPTTTGTTSPSVPPSSTEISPPLSMPTMRESPLRPRDPASSASRSGGPPTTTTRWPGPWTDRTGRDSPSTLGSDATDPAADLEDSDALREPSVFPSSSDPSEDRSGSTLSTPTLTDPPVSTIWRSSPARPAEVSAVETPTTDVATKRSARCSFRPRGGQTTSSYRSLFHFLYDNVT